MNHTLTVIHYHSWLKRRSASRLPVVLLVIVMPMVATVSGLVTGYFIGRGEPTLYCPAPAPKSPASKKTNSLMRTV